MVTEVARSYGVNTATVYRWIRLYERTGRVSSLLSMKRDGGRGRSRLNPEVEKIIRATIEDFYLSKQQRDMQQTCDEATRRFKNAGLEPPHPNIVRNRYHCFNG
jgi:putative transposase